MRVSTGMIFASGVNNIQNRTSSLLRTQQQISSGRRMLAPSDDPVAAARALEVTQAKEVNAQYGTAQTNAKSALGLMDGQLSSAGDMLTRIRELAVQGGNGALSGSDRKSIAAELRARFDELLALSNSTDGTGQYLFSGYQGNNKPFAGSVENGVAYVGDDGQRTLRVSASRSLPVSQSGNDVFMRIRNGNGTFVTGLQEAKSVNIHTASINTGTITDATLWNAPANPNNIEVRFWTDTAGGGVASRGYAAASVVAPATITAGVNDTFNVSLNGGAATPVTLTAGAFSLVTVQNDLNLALGAGNAVASLDATGRLVISSNTASTSTTPSSVALSPAVGDTGQFASLLGAPVATPGVYSYAGQTFYDLVDKATGKSLFTGSASTTGGGGTYTHAYTSGATIALSSAGPSGSTAFDFGANVSVSGLPITGDAFTITRGSGSLSTSPVTISHSNATIDKGVVSDPVKWSAASNNQDMEIRFWTDSAGAIGTAGATYYDLVDVTTGKSLYTGTPSATGAGGTYGTHQYYGTQGTLTGAVDLSAGVTINATNFQLDLTVDGSPLPTVNLPQGTYTFSSLQAQLQSQLRPYGVTVGSSGNFLMLTSDRVGGASSVAPIASTGATALFGALLPPPPLLPPSQGTVNPNGSIALKGAGFDFGAYVTVSGIPANGDTFTIKGSQDALGNGYFVTGAKTQASANMGSGIIGKGEVLDPQKWNSPNNSRQLEVRFWKDPSDKTANPPTYYDLVDVRTEKSLFTNSASTSGGAANTYTHVFKSGDPIAFSGLAAPYGDFGAAVTIQGAPASGDVFTLGDSTTQSVFESLGNLIQTLEGPVGPIGSNTNAELQNKVGFVLTNLSGIEDNILKVRADIGTHLSEVDDLGAVRENLDLQYAETLSNLQDVDYAKAITDLTRLQTELQAAQQSFVKIANLSLFSYL